MQKAVIVWKDNIPTVESHEIFPSGQLMAVTETILAEPYNDPLELFPQYKGMSNGEVVLRQLIGRATLGCKDATKELLDRLVGKPKQQIETKKLSMTYADYLDAIDRNTIDASQTPTE